MAHSYEELYTMKRSSQVAHGKDVCACRRHRRRGSDDPWVGKILWRRKWQPTPLFLLGELRGQRSLVAYSPQGHKESDTEHAPTYLLH